MYISEQRVPSLKNAQIRVKKSGKLPLPKWPDMSPRTQTPPPPVGPPVPIPPGSVH